MYEGIIEEDQDGSTDVILRPELDRRETNEKQNLSVE
jgi:hypothetical protein